MTDTILVALDGSRLAEQALTHTCRLARQTRAALVLLRVAPFTTISENVAAPWSGTVWEAEQYLTGVRERLARDGITARAIVVPGDAPRGIVAVAETGGADLIAMGAHGRSGPRQALLGTVAQAVLHRTTMPDSWCMARTGLAWTAPSDFTPSWCQWMARPLRKRRSRI